jgi:DNA-binding MarR family transcriptional regulator
MSDLTNDLMNTLGGIIRKPQIWVAMNPHHGQYGHGQRNRNNSSTSRLMRILAEQDDLTAGAISEILDIRPSSVTELINKLEKRGLVEKKPDKGDKRVTRISLTKQGQEQINSRAHARDEYSEEIFESLSKSEQETLNQLLTKLQDGLGEADFGDFVHESVNNFRQGFEPDIKDYRDDLKKMSRNLKHNFRGRDFKDIF